MVGFTKDTVVQGVSLPLSSDFGPTEACPWGQAELRGSAPRWGYAFSFQSLHGGGCTGPGSKYHGGVQETGKSLVPVGFMALTLLWL